MRKNQRKVNTNRVTRKKWKLLKAKGTYSIVRVEEKKAKINTEMENSTNDLHVGNGCEDTRQPVSKSAPTYP